MKTFLIAPLASFLILIPATAQDAASAKPAEQAWHVSDAYPLDTCVVSGRPFAGDKVHVVEVEGRRYKLCSEACAPKLRKAAPAYLAKLDRAVIDAQLADYPLDRCPVSGKQLGSMGETAHVVLGNHLVRLCCRGCTTKAKARTGEIVRTIEASAYEKQKDSYPLTTCLKTGHPLLPKTTVEVMHGPTLLRFGGKDCLDVLEQSPATVLAKLDEARKAKAAARQGEKPATGQPHKDHEHERREVHP